jgi:hypothetical protein
MAISTLDGDPYSIMFSCPKEWVIASGKASQITHTHPSPPQRLLRKGHRLIPHQRLITAWCQKRQPMPFPCGIKSSIS